MLLLADIVPVFKPCNDCPCTHVVIASRTFLPNMKNDPMRSNGIFLNRSESNFSATDTLVSVIGSYVCLLRSATWYSLYSAKKKRSPWPTRSDIHQDTGCLNSQDDFGVCAANSCCGHEVAMSKKQLLHGFHGGECQDCASEACITGFVLAFLYTSQPQTDLVVFVQHISFSSLLGTYAFV